MSEISAKRKELEKGCGLYNSCNSLKCVKGCLCNKCNESLELFNLGVEMARKEILDKLDNSKISITQRIADEYRKHPTLDWTLIATQKIIAELKQELENVK